MNSLNSSGRSLKRSLVPFSSPGISPGFTVVNVPDISISSSIPVVPSASSSISLLIGLTLISTSSVPFISIPSTLISPFSQYLPLRVSNISRRLHSEAERDLPLASAVSLARPSMRLPSRSILNIVWAYSSEKLIRVARSTL